MRRGLSKPGEKKGGAVLIVLDGPGKGDEFPVTGEMSIGRTQDNTLVRVERGVSRRHCIIKDEGGVYTITDLGSANGTLLNDKKLVQIEVLRDGDHIAIGESRYLFHWPEGAVASGDATCPGLSKAAESTQPGVKAEQGQAPPRRRRKAILIAGGVVLLVLVGLAVKIVVTGNATLGPSDLSDEPIAYSDSTDFHQTAFGLGDYDDAHPDRALITFHYLKGRATLRYSVWGVDQAGEVIIKLNGQRVGDAPVTQEYRHEVRLELPRNMLREGTNELEFDSTRNPPEEDPWEVAFVRLDQEPLLPPDPQAAQQQYQQGLRYYEDREVDPANLYKAFEKFKMARDLLEQSDPRPTMYDESTAMMERISRELHDVFELGRFSAERAYRVGEVDQARAFLERTIRYFPDPQDARQAQLSRALESLDGE